MNSRILVVVFVCFALLLVGCGKSKKEETAPATDTMTSQQPPIPKLDAAKVSKSVDALVDIAAMSDKYEKMKKPETAEEQQKLTQQVEADMNAISQKYGFSGAADLVQNLDIIFMIYLLEEQINALTAQLAQVGDDQKAQVQTSLQQAKGRYDEVRKSQGEDVLKAIEACKPKITKYLDNMKAKMAAQQTQQTQTIKTNP